MGVVSAVAYLSSGNPEPTDAERRFATETRANSKAGYSFAYPPRWGLREHGSVARVLSPRRDASVSFGVGPPGGLRRSSIRFVSELQDTYDQVSLSGFQLTLLDGEPAVSFTGAATTHDGNPIRLQAVSVAGAKRNYSLVVFLSADADLARVLPPIQEIVDSFRLVR